MAKKSKKDVRNKTLSEMSDTEFITYADYLASPYYRAYVNARAQSEMGGYVIRLNEPETPKKRGYVKKRGLALLIIAILMLAVTVVGVIGLVGAAVPAEYIGVIKLPGATESADKYVTLIDGVYALLGKNNREKSVYYTEFMAERLNAEGVNTMTKISLYATPVAAGLLLIFSAIAFLKALIALFSGKNKEGYYHKFKFGFLSIASFFCAAIVVLGALYAAGINKDTVAQFFTFKSEIVRATYMTYVILAAPLITFILSCIGYKKEPKVAKKR